jgi:hypothetical protein
MQPLITLIVNHGIRAKKILAVALMFAVLPVLNARITQAWTYQEMFSKADLVVIADVVSTSETEERSALTDVEPHVAVIGVVTSFKSRLVLKGSPSLSSFRLHYYRFQIEDDKLAANSPELIEISGKDQTFLLFLTKEPDGKYAPVTGQTDPASFSVLELKGAAN